MPYPSNLTTSDWVDYLAQPNLSRDERIACLATFHRRIEAEAQTVLLDNMNTAEAPIVGGFGDRPVDADPVGAAIAVARTKITKPADYQAR